MNLKESLKSRLIKFSSLRKISKITKIEESIRVDIGCGSSKREGYIGLDILPGADIQWDLSWGLPFPDNSVTDICSDHCFEHLDLPLVLYVLKECRRVLKPGGRLDFTVPHINPYLNAYEIGDINFLKEKIFDVPSGEDDLYNTCFDRIAWLLLRSGEHRSLFDRDSILDKVRLAGFEKFCAREFDSTRDYNYRFSSIYVVAIK